MNKRKKPMLKTTPHSGEFRMLIASSGQVIAPDLTESMLPIFKKLGGEDSIDATLKSSAVDRPCLISARHASGGHPSLLDRNIARGHLQLRNCTMCENRCAVDRSAGEIGICGLGVGLSVSGYSMLYNEGPFVGQPTFGIFLKGCSLRCKFCYRPKDLSGKGASVMSAEALANVLDDAAEAGAQSWHFLGGNPDESLVGVLEALRLTKRTLPIAWNSALYLSADALELLTGIVDIWLPDMKFGNDECAKRIAGVSRYSATIRRNLLALRNEPFVVVRHMHYPDHEHCCWEPVRAWVTEHLPKATMHELQYVRTTNFSRV